MKCRVRFAVAGLLTLSAAVSQAQSYPVRPITLLCWSASGSPVDIYPRIMAKLLAADLGQNVIVENRTGGSGIIMVNTLLRAPADGYAIAANTITLAALFSEPTAAFKPDDLQMIARSQVDPYGLVVHTSTPFKTILDGFQGPDEFHAQLLKDMREMQSVKKKLGL